MVDLVQQGDEVEKYFICSHCGDNRVGPNECVYYYIPWLKRVLPFCKQCAHNFKFFGKAWLPQSLQQNLEIPVFRLEENRYYVDLLVNAGLCQSKSIARRQIIQGKVAVDGEILFNVSQKVKNVNETMLLEVNDTMKRIKIKDE